MRLANGADYLLKLPVPASPKCLAGFFAVTSAGRTNKRIAAYAMVPWSVP